MAGTASITLFIMVIASALPIQATMLTVDIVGSVIGVEAELEPYFGIGDFFSIRFVVDSTVPCFGGFADCTDLDVAAYDDALSDIQIQLSGVFYTFSTATIDSTRVRVQPGVFETSAGRLQVQAHLLGGTAGPGRLLAFDMQDQAEYDSYPTSGLQAAFEELPSHIGQDDQSLVLFSFSELSSANVTLRTQINSVVVAIIPEPGTALLLGLGLAGLAWMKGNG